MRGKRSPHFLIAPGVKPVLDAVQSAVEDGDLPLPASIPREQRFAKIRRLVDKRLKAQSR